ncbi:hypothetical protein GCM10025868_17710 [Angustibacter aerolatus]|uniref:Bacterial transcriptional activator domain-containing protein n=1 Tax=Angustibacter aerolatus TaxID=1162965 RepID=A0ABQ6JG43_9ACTN|nr:hypothetical protein [Angustibacter aerolatus]GMA86521.1 hypothetical protein GCM10025868_17710 [Angustibacter aerolatus]
MLLAAHPEGLTGEQAATALHEHPVAAVTLRAEVARLRGLLGADLLRSRPYRLHGSCRSDADEVRRLLRAGRLGAAVDRYRGPLLPTSDAPEVSRMRQRLHDDLRAALLHGDDPDALLRFADTEHGRMDWTAWQAAERMLPPSSGRREQVRAHLQVLDAEPAPLTRARRGSGDRLGRRRTGSWWRTRCAPRTSALPPAPRW